MSLVVGMNRYEYFKNVGGLSHQPNLAVKAARNVRRVPQVMFKAVKSGFASGFIGLSAQMGYVLGKASAIIDPSGEVDRRDHLGAKEVGGIASRWVDSWVKSAKDNRHSMHLVASFPSGTHPGAAEYIIRDTCEELLSQGRNRFEYIAAIHTDTNNPHGHIIVNRRNEEGEWFYLARDHEFTYDRFKDSLVKHAAKYGVELNNSSRLSRGYADYATDTRKTAMSGLEGVVKDFGAAPYLNDKRNSASYFITLHSKFGERTMWGVGLAEVMQASGANHGDKIVIKHEGKKPVVVPTRDGKSVKTHRNDWRIQFNGREYGSFDNEIIPTEREVSVANARREMVVREAGTYQRFSDIVRGGYLALGIAFSAAARVLRDGQSVNVLDRFMEANMSDVAAITEADIRSDGERLEETLEKTRNELNDLWHRLPSIDVNERPRFEQGYFEAVGKLDHVVSGESRREFSIPAQGSVYSDENRKRFTDGMTPALSEKLEESGINADEFAARMSIEDCSYALESHWIERDIEAIAKINDLNLHTEAGKTQALQMTAELHSVIGRELAERNETSINQSDWKQLESFSQSLSQINWSDSIAAAKAEAQLREFAPVSEIHAELASAAIDNSTGEIPENIREFYVAREDRHELNKVIEPHAIDMSSSVGFNDGLKAVEAYYFGDNSLDNVVNELKDLAKKDSITFDDSKRIVEGLNAILGKNGMERLNRADTSVFKDMGINVDRDEAVRITESYSMALQKQGFDMDKFDKALGIEKDLHKATDQLKRLEGEQERGDEARALSLKEDRSYGL